MKITEAQKVAAAAWRIRRYALRMGEVQGQGYIGQALGYADVLATAFSHAMTYRPQEPQWEGRDRFLLSHGHYAIAYYAALLEALLPSGWRWGCGKKGAHPGSTTPCRMGSWMKVPPGKRRCRRRITA